MARPKLDIDATEVYKLAKFHCTNKEIAEFFSCSVDTITDRFPEELRKGRAEGKHVLRKLQWAAAGKGNVAMLIWLGKQYLMQSDQPVPEDTTPEEYRPPESMTDDRQ
jgi:hypothetical protein